MIYLVYDTEDGDYLLTKYTENKEIIDYHDIRDDSTNDGSGWQLNLIYSDKLTAVPDTTTDSFMKWLDTPVLKTMATFDSLAEYDKYVDDHPELQI